MVLFSIASLGRGNQPRDQIKPQIQADDVEAMESYSPT